MRNSRRQFLLTTAATGGALVCGISFANTGTGSQAARNSLRTAPAMAVQGKDITAAIEMNAWLRIGADGTVWLAMPRSEMGQGAHIGLRMLVAEELGCKLESIELEDPDVSAEFANQTVLAESVPFRPDDEGMVANTARSVMRRTARLLNMQVTGGSTSIMDGWNGVHGIAAATRQRLEKAAAVMWGVDADEVNLTEGVITSTNGQRMPMTDALVKALSVSAPSNVRFRSPANYRYIGQNPPRTDLRSKVDGSAVYGIDVRITGRIVGVPLLCPTIGGSVKQVLNRDALLARPGVLDVIVMPTLSTSGGVLILAKGYWPALQAARAAQVEWFIPPQAANLDTQRISMQLRNLVDTGSVHWTYLKRGNAGWFKDAATPAQVEGRYEVPFLAHSTMEPMNATALLKDGRLEVWAPTQAQGPARDRAAQAAGLSASAVRINTTYLGGAFGRRLETDFIAMAAMAAAKMPGTPVQVIWPREEDTTHDYYRPAAAARMQARVDKKGRITHWHHRCANPSVSHQAFQRVGLPGLGPDKTNAEGGFDSNYAFENACMDHVLFDAGVPVGYWRSVGHSYNAFFVESFMDELAAAAGMDPVTFRLKNLPKDSREARVLKTVCDMAGYLSSDGGAMGSVSAEVIAAPAAVATVVAGGKAGNAASPAGSTSGSASSAGSNGLAAYLSAGAASRPNTALGVAVHASFGSVVAMIAELQRTPKGAKVARIWCAAECGLPVYPDGIRQQLEGGIIFGLTAALKSRVDIDAGAVRQRNFNDYPLLSLAETPAIQVRVLPSGNMPAGAGEISVPPVAPAIANALFRLTGDRQRVLPLRL